MHRSSAGISDFRLAKKSQLGYSCAEVDEFFSRLADDFEELKRGSQDQNLLGSADIRSYSFSAAEGGYAVQDVDRALDRVEDRFAEFERAARAQSLGAQGWEDAIEAEASLLMGRLEREAGKRFRRPSARLTKGYYVRDVDELCTKLAQHFRSGESLDPSLVRKATFRSATGDMCYEETQVDAFLDRCIGLILDLRV